MWSIIIHKEYSNFHAKRKFLLAFYRAKNVQLFYHCDDDDNFDFDPEIKKFAKQLKW